MSLQAGIGGGGATSPAGASGGDPAAAVTAALFAPISSTTAFEQTVERLATAVRLGILPPGSRLPPERDLADGFEIARGTLRQALTALIQSGLLIARRGRTGGTWVTDHLPPMPGADCTVDGDWHRIIDSRLAAESGVVLLAAQRATPEHLAALDDLISEIDVVVAEERTFEEHRQVDIRFHLVLADASGSSELMARAAEAQHAMSDLLGRASWPKAVLERSNDQHRAIVDALRLHDGGAAAAAMFEHVEGSRLIREGLGGGARDVP